jgi:threonine synthase
MKLRNIKHPDQLVTFREAVMSGLGRDRGLFFPERIRPLQDIEHLLSQDFVARSTVVLQHLTNDELPLESMRDMVTRAFDFPIRVQPLRDGTRALELFHGPSLAFKDFGARFMAQCLATFQDGEHMTILTATSGDTGAAVAHAYYGMENIRVVVLYPEGKISPLQEKLFCTLGGNITTVAVKADFDSCQKLVKQAFDDEDIRKTLRLNSANSINIARLFAQVCYYFEGAVGATEIENLVYCVPSGNFGNLTAALIARAAGLEYKRVIAATNANDTVPRFLASGAWNPRATVSTITNAMDVSLPNNFPRVLELGERHGLDLPQLLSSVSLDDESTRNAMRMLHSSGYLADPHSALAWAGLKDSLAADEHGVFLCTAHPAKFYETIEETLGVSIPLPAPLAAVRDLEVRSQRISAEFTDLKELLFN